MREVIHRQRRPHSAGTLSDMTEAAMRWPVKE